MKNLRKAVREYKEINKGGYYDPHYGYLMYDTETNDLWCSEFYDLGHNSYIDYSDCPEVINLGRMMREHGVEINEKNVKAFVLEHFESNNIDTEKTTD